jgi:hypothetical protein
MMYCINEVIMILYINEVIMIYPWNNNDISME